MTFDDRLELYRLHFHATWDDCDAYQYLYGMAFEYDADFGHDVVALPIRLWLSPSK